MKEPPRTTTPSSDTSSNHSSEELDIVETPPKLDNNAPRISINASRSDNFRKIADKHKRGSLKNSKTPNVRRISKTLSVPGNSRVQIASPMKHDHFNLQL